MIKVKLIFKQTDYLNDVQDIPRAFAPYMVVDENAESFFKWEYNYSDGIFHVSVSSDLWEAYTDSIKVSDADFVEYKRETKFFLKTVLYRYLSEHLQIRLPYGSLTGVRPTKMYYELSEKSEHPEAKLIEKYDVLPKKAELIADCVKNQKNYINRDPKGVALFLNIPFCPTRCKYCSFISTEVSRVRKELPLYVECVKKEWDGIFEIIAKNGYNVKSVYVGGGTPTSVGSVYLDAMIAPLKNFGVEFTVEAGRPDTISEEILGVLQNNGVTRISVNPQTFKNSTLELIGRRHTVEDVYRCFEMVRSFGFHFDVNADLIATLPEETYGDFVHSVDECIALSPENITIHTLSLKRGSVFTVSGMEKEKFGLARKNDGLRARNS
jgi:oxygen-independent coproporphyrinogen-3 oxidase